MVCSALIETLEQASHLMIRPWPEGELPMPELFESKVFDSATTAIMRSALEVAILKCKPSRADEEQVRIALARVIKDQVNAGEWKFANIVDKTLAAYASTQNISRSA
jgi:hypothetical protein